MNAPVVIRTVINRGGEQGAQHSQALHAMFAHVPGLKVVMPSTPYDAKGLLMAAVEDGNPVMYIDDRWLYDEQGPVPEEPFVVAIGTGVVRRRGSEVTIVAVASAVPLALEAAAALEKDGVDAEVIDLRSIKPWDRELVLDSVRKTGRLVVADAAWKTCGFAAEVSAVVAEEAFVHLKAPVQRVCLPDTPAPTSAVLERAYYLRAGDIVDAVARVLGVGLVRHA